MGNLLSVTAVKAPPQQTDARTAFLGTKSASDSSSTAAGAGVPPPPPLYLSDVKAEPAPWSQEGFCLTFQRLFGLLPDSEAERLKQAQRQPQFQRRPSSFGMNVYLRADAIVVAQRVYRRYRLLAKWHDVAGQMLELARSRIETRKAIEEEQMTLTKFRALLTDGFSAHKVSITGALKAIHLQLVMDARAEECYLTWSPSRKRQPRIHLHDVEQVVPVLRTGNKHAPRLANKVSHRRGLIIVCKSHHRGRVVLEMASKRERNLLLCGFERLLEEMNHLNPTLDDAGAIRKRLPRRQSVLEFFDAELRPPTPTSSDRGGEGSDALEERRPSSSDATDAPHAVALTLASSSSESAQTPARRNSASLEQLYATRYDSAASKPMALVRRSSMLAVGQT